MLRSRSTCLVARSRLHQSLWQLSTLRVLPGDRFAGNKQTENLLTQVAPKCQHLSAPPAEDARTRPQTSSLGPACCTPGKMWPRMRCRKYPWTRAASKRWDIPLWVRLPTRTLSHTAGKAKVTWLVLWHALDEGLQHFRRHQCAIYKDGGS